MTGVRVAGVERIMVWRKAVAGGVLAVASVLCLAVSAYAEPAPTMETGAVAVAAPQLDPGSFEGRLQSLIAAPLAGKSTAGDKDDVAGAKAFYAARNYAPLWVSETGLNARAKAAATEIARADNWGLKAADFALPEAKPGDTREQLAAAEFAMTRAALKYGRFARGGRIANPSTELSEYIDRVPQLIAPQTLMSEMSAAGRPDDYLKGLNPRHPQFERLRQAYLKARADQNRMTAMWVESGAMLRPGDSDPRVLKLRARLSVPEPAAVPGALSQTETYDPALVQAVKAFQTANGLRGDGMIGEKTRNALNAGNESKIPALLANMEQWRWMPATLGETYVQVNIPEFKVRLMMNGATVHEERVVTGKPDTSTPIFSEAMQTVVFQPKWGVPESIKINELLPRLQNGGGLRSGLKMSLNGREIDPWSVDWSRADIKRYMIYQPSGDDNALGVVKFLFPNKHAVYLHDTPSKSLFNANTRAYSHGCIRVRNPVRLAELVLGADKGWDAARVRSLVEDGPEDNPIKLDTKIPVHVTYFTAAVDENGKIETFPDVYGHERRITQALTGRADQIAKLSPPPLGETRTRRAVAYNDDGAPQPPPVRRRQAEPRYEPPVALGYKPAPQQGFQLFSGKSTGSRNYRGNSPNDLVMRSLGGF